MAIVKWDPFININALQDRINRLFDESFPRSAETDEELAMCAWRPNVDIYQTDAGITLKAELPGVNKEDVSVEIKDNVLTLRGERFADEEVKEENYFRRERCCGLFQRAFTLQTKVNPDEIKARFKNGILEVRIPKPAVETPKQIKVDID